ncbi:MAG: mannose-1-phosphate guanylyltransferase/mannose-6-phosphate isomerase [Dichotomicrobium sp.]
MSSQIYPVILCGGSGTRLWPLSRAQFPKQFIPFFDGSEDSLLAGTLRRLHPDDGFRPPTLLTHDDHRFLLREQVERTGIAPREILLEPVSRNTAPAMTAAALSIAAEDPEAVLAVMPSDHLLDDADAFARTVRSAGAMAADGRLMLLGVAPGEPHTGYGYIRTGETLGVGQACAVAAFVEKPDAETAAQYLADGGYLWNSGIFVLPAAVFIEEVERLAPEIAENARAALDDAECDLGFRRLAAEPYAKCPNISVDYAVMEKTPCAGVMPLATGWSDVGSWSSVWAESAHDSEGNAVRGDAMLMETRNSYVHSNGALVATIGVEDIVVVHTPDAALVARRDRAEDVGKLVAELRASNRREPEQHTRSHRPWGHFETLSAGPRFQVKLLHVKPGGQLSLQMHHHRSEHWVVVKGTARVTCEGETRLVGENESVYISATQWHRLENPGMVPLEIIEVQIGGYLGEDDIVRSDDAYRRGPHETK